MNPAEVVENLRKYYGSYHDHKENMAYAATTLYIAVATALIFHGRALLSGVHPQWIGPVLLLLGFVVGHAFVIWQLANREIAAIVLHAASVVLLNLAVAPASAPDMRPSRWCGQTLPRVLVAEIQTRLPVRFLGGARTASSLTVVATMASSLLVFIAVYM